MAMHRDSAEHEFVTLPLSNPPKLPSKAENRQNEQKRTYDERVREVEHGTFPPLSFFPLAAGTQCYRGIQKDCLPNY